MSPHTALSEFSFELPNYLLLEVFEYLPGQDLVVASHTCRLWNQLIMARRRLRTNAFIPSSHNPTVPVADIELHPVVSQLHFDTTVDAADAQYGVRKSPRKLLSAAVSKQLATSPAVTELRLDVMKYHPHVLVENPAGVKVADVVEELAKYKAAATNFTFEEFFGRELCSQRGYERKKSMQRVDMVGNEKVLVTFAPGVAFNGTVLFEAVRFRSVDAAKRAAEEPKKSVDTPAPHHPPRSVDAAAKDDSHSKKSEGYRFWSAFAFEVSASASAAPMSVSA